jgi:hypothetical protein
MLKSYDAIYDKGRLHWVGRAPQLEHARVMVVVSEPDPSSVSAEPSLERNGVRLAAILRDTPPELAARLGQRFGDPLSWQREQRQDRILPGREDD